jgi:hypothetical protein
MSAVAVTDSQCEAPSPLSFLQVTLPILWTRGPGQMVMVTSELEFLEKIYKLLKTEMTLIKLASPGNTNIRGKAQ